MAWSADSTFLDLHSLVTPGLDKAFSPQIFGGQQEKQPQPQQFQQQPQQQPQQYQMFDTPQQVGYTKTYLDVPFGEYGLLSPGGESGYSSSCSVGQASPMSRNPGGSPAPLRPASRTTPALDLDMEATFITSAANTLNNYGPAAFDSQNNLYDTVNSSFDTSYERLDTSYGSPAAGYASPYVEPSYDSPYSSAASSSYEPQQSQDEDARQFSVPSGKLKKMSFYILHSFFSSSFSFNRCFFSLSFSLFFFLSWSCLHTPLPDDPKGGCKYPTLTFPLM